MTDVQEADKVVRFTLLDETGPHDSLLFSCRDCPDSKMTSFQLESHMNKHEANKFTVDTSAVARARTTRTKSRASSN